MLRLHVAQVGQAKPEVFNEILEPVQFVLVGRFVDAMNSWKVLFVQMLGHHPVSCQHELLDQFMCDVVFGLDDVLDLPLGSHLNLRLGNVEIDASFLKPALAQQLAECVHIFQNWEGGGVFFFC